MNREFLQGLKLGDQSLSKEIIDAIMDENGKDIETAKKPFADYAALKEKADKLDAQEEAAKSDLQKAQDKTAQLEAQLTALQQAAAARDARDKVSAATGVPASLLTGDTEETCKAQADAILAWRGGQPQYPETHDAGEPPVLSGGKTRDQFAEWASNMMPK